MCVSSPPGDFDADSSLRTTVPEHGVVLNLFIKETTLK